MLLYELFFGQVLVQTAQLGSILLDALKELLGTIPPAVWGNWAVAPLLALIVNLAKKLPFWKDGWAGWASLILNFLFAFFGVVARMYGVEAEAGNLLEITYNFLSQAIPIFWGIVSAVGLTKAAHELFKKWGMAVKAQTDEVEAILRDVGKPGSDSPDLAVPTVVPRG
jgi:hypothetical protein